MRQFKNSLLLVMLTLFQISCSDNNESKNDIKDLGYESGYNDFLELAENLRTEREKRLVNLNTFLRMAKDSNTVILDSRSSQLFDSKHMAGAINLPFTEYTQSSLENLIPNKNTRILIYCNNNFKGDDSFFESKLYIPENDWNNKHKPILLALNIPTFITLNGYGYNNVYELKETIHIRDPRLNFEGSSVMKVTLINSLIEKTN